MKLESCSCCTICWNFRENLQRDKPHITRRLHKIITREKFQSCQVPGHPKTVVKEGDGTCIYVLTLITMTSFDWKRVGLAAGSKTDALDWND